MAGVGVADTTASTTDHHHPTTSITCQTLPHLLSSFVDTFVDFSVSGGLFLPPNPLNPNNNPINPNPPPLQTTYPSPNRLVAIGDLHGDLHKSRQALTLAGLIDASGRWTGGAATVVQVGDVLDRGGEELKILYFLEKLRREAVKYVTQAGLDEFKVWADWYCIGNSMKSLCNGLEKPKDPFRGLPSVFPNVKSEITDGIRARIAALRPEGPISSRFLANNLTVAVVGESVFVHGGLLPNHVTYGLDRINEEVRNWISGMKQGIVPSGLIRGRNSVVWLRRFSNELAKNCDCSMLEHVLATIPGAKRMIMGHTIQESGINGVCKNRAIRIDVGMSKGCGDGLPEVLEIVGNSDLRVLTSNPLFLNRYQSSVESNQKEGIGLLIPEHGPQPVEVQA
ncbi:hypothetical protein C3L33_17667, partial [Rhododendron williamsianum]